MNRPPDPEEQDRYERDRIRYQWLLDSIHKFRIFFVALVFSMLAFSVQFAIEPRNSCVNVLQVLAWAALLLCGLFALREAGGFKKINHDESFNGLPPNLRVAMWSLFVAGVVLLMVARVANQT